MQHDTLESSAAVLTLRGSEDKVRCAGQSYRQQPRHHTKGTLPGGEAPSWCCGSADQAAKPFGVALFAAF